MIAYDSGFGLLLTFGTFLIKQNSFFCLTERRSLRPALRVPVGHRLALGRPYG